MLYLAKSLQQLRFGDLMEVYMEGNLEKASEAGLLQGEQDFYQYLRDCFFPTDGAVYAVWVKGSEYISALRLEPYKDGLLLEALETAPKHRRKGYATKLVNAVLAQFPDQKIYSHVSKRNAPSLTVHEKCGFRKILDSATYIDGSVNAQAVTLCNK
ncbi:MAG: GNAT family N-acetyltransferase [Oscillospiraceae bacterium]|nr:GNAT family N-acetyltransferase [Oscillospiraceae bacterium]